MSSMNNFNNNYALPSKAIMESGHDIGMHRRDGKEEYGDPIYLQKNSTAVQRALNTLSKRLKWRSSANNSNNIKRTHITNHNNARCAMFHIFNELLSKEEEKEKNEGKKEEKIEEKGESNEDEKGKNEEKIRKKEKNLMEQKTFLCQHLDQLTNGTICQSQEMWDYGNCAETNPWTHLTKLKPDYLCEQLDKNNQFGFYQVTNKDSLGSIDAEYTEFLNETFGITGVQPVFIDHSGFVIWLLDKVGNMYQWNEMQRSLRYMEKDFIDGLTNHFIYPEKLCEVMEDTGELIPVEEFKRKMEEKAKRM
ncbi:hypothetical protein GLOIN_2v1791304 [Rhizophagus irregularis DAOM 181602=DAOM 197198]|uniref:Uncharacterized protein n=1 Tax=Rhizophagus irregularis (strain DAOM 181602 / DAOM 197198 / MUCL 43194) TaxID=747089 RepID=A0A2P4NXF2_RHIID|nr:hypothetical protein GLOIN_2v1791304 [Rhizophagus irregularis DAOM 181602=DAOM 197198]POG57778.1 hypothetical protein GLOIN_2v1791304 [Rhizophagus irregularis DAOM 181602=DAOM 197198]GBC13757.2 hypothetical protein GLOIN_2v1791304 [Rhizophagus irregularis DAOM 181602=DAOM 197198]|eukprot:XP_025164644.1 hypothetical protein GLOIN_2v1791304 [Rhizophagus irregularis DAOM 181602=DAOM 197198]